MKCMPSFIKIGGAVSEKNHYTRQTFVVLYIVVNDRTNKNRVRPNPEALAISTEASAEASAESLPKIPSKTNVFYDLGLHFFSYILK